MTVPNPGLLSAYCRDPQPLIQNYYNSNQSQGGVTGVNTCLHACAHMHMRTRMRTHCAFASTLLFRRQSAEGERERERESYLVYVVVSRGPDWGLALWGHSEHGLGLCGTRGSVRLNRSAENQNQYFILKG